MTDTIYAPASAPGKAGVAVIRVSGPHARQSLQSLTRKMPPPRHAVLTSLIHPRTQDLIDRALVLFFQAPASFTGEDVAEYHIHGSRAVMQALLEALSAQPHHRMAGPGEFTRRAFENGKLDLTETEALADLINAETQTQKAQALKQMEGALSRLYEGWAANLKTMLAHIEADIEFPDEDMPQGILPGLLPQIENLAAEVASHLNDNRRGERLRDGVRIAILGAPNAGKSSLLNALAQRDVAIVSSIAGTTRDVIEAHLDLGGYPAIICDTAGLRDSGDEIENEGMRRAALRAAEADLKILLFDAANGHADEATMLHDDGQALHVWNKADLAAPDFAQDGFLMSVKTGEGLDALIHHLTQAVADLIGASETPSITRGRHREALNECLAALTRAACADLPELVAEDLRIAIRFLGRITGRVDVEDLLDVIFRDFCIGK